jgi:hypothetical protein
MHVILLALGLVSALAGLALIGLGIPNNAVAPGNTFIMSGTMALMAGLLLTGLASAIRQLRRIAQLLETRPIPRALGPEPETVRAPVVTPPDEPPVAVESERRSPPLSPVPEPAGAAVEVRAPRIDERSLRVTAEEDSVVPEPVQHDRPAAADEPAHAEHAPPPPPSAPARMTFDTTWTEERVAEAPRQPLRQAAREVPREASREAPRERPAAPAAAPAAPATIGRELRATAEPAQGVHIFKSGVIDGMAYTLYTDGSIEAELAGGTVKFASIDELRAYLGAREP